MSISDLDLADHLISECRGGHNVFDVPLINERIITSRTPYRTTDQLRQDLVVAAGEMKVNNIPMMTPDEIATEYNNILDRSFSLMDDPQPTTSEIEQGYSSRGFKPIHHDQGLLEVVGFKLKQWVHSAPVTHPRSQRNFLMDYSHLRDPMRKYLLSHSVNSMNQSIVDFAQKGGYSCFHRCLPNPGNKITEAEKRCVHFCGETLADVRKILATDWLNYSENLDNMAVSMLPAGHEMGDKETGTFNSSNRSSQWNQYSRYTGQDTQWINKD